MPAIDVIFSPALIPFYDLKGKNVVVIDILRATTSICVALSNGARGVVPVMTPEECMSYRFKDEEYVVAAERDGVPVPGFDIGNSPLSFTQKTVLDKYIAISTTNGTYTIKQSESADNIFIGSFLNLDALCLKLLRLNQDVMLICAGWKNKFNLEDSLFAGAVVEKLKDHFLFDEDASKAALLLWEQSKDNLLEVIKNASHSRRFDRLGIVGDTEFCLQLNTMEMVPYYNKGTLFGELVREIDN